MNHDAGALVVQTGRNDINGAAGPGIPDQNRSILQGGRELRSEILKLRAEVDILIEDMSQGI